MYQQIETKSVHDDLPKYQSKWTKKAISRFANRIWTQWRSIFEGVVEGTGNEGLERRRKKSSVRDDLHPYSWHKERLFEITAQSHLPCLICSDIDVSSYLKCRVIPRLLTLELHRSLNFFLFLFINIFTTARCARIGIRTIHMNF